MTEGILIGERGLSYKNHWRNCGGIENEDFSLLDEANKTGKVILCFGGDGTTTPFPDRANAVAKGAAGYLTPETLARTRIFSVSYPVKDEEYKTSVNHYPEFFAKYLAPFIADIPEADRYAVEARRRYVDESKNNLRKIVFYTHCFGSTVLADIENMMKMRMALCGYAEAEQKDILHQCFAVNMTDRRMTMTESDMTSFYLFSLADDLLAFPSVPSFKTLLLDIQKDSLFLAPSEKSGVLVVKQFLEGDVIDDEHNDAFLEHDKALSADGGVAKDFMHRVFNYVLSTSGNLPSVQGIADISAGADLALQEFVSRLKSTKNAVSYFLANPHWCDVFAGIYDKKVDKDFTPFVEKGKNVYKYDFPVFKEQVLKDFNAGKIPDLDKTSEIYLRALTLEDNKTPFLDAVINTGRKDLITSVVDSYCNAGLARPSEKIKAALKEKQYDTAQIFASFPSVDYRDISGFVFSCEKEEIAKVLPIMKEVFPRTSSFGDADIRSVFSLMNKVLSFENKQKGKQLVKEIHEIAYPVLKGQAFSCHKLCSELGNSALDFVIKDYEKAASEKCMAQTVSDFVHFGEYPIMDKKAKAYARSLYNEILDMAQKYVGDGAFAVESGYPRNTVGAAASEIRKARDLYAANPENVKQIKMDLFVAVKKRLFSLLPDEMQKDLAATSAVLFKTGASLDM